MGERRKLTEDEIGRALADVPGWEVRDGKLHRELKFADFAEAFGFMATMATVMMSSTRVIPASRVTRNVRVGKCRVLMPALHQHRLLECDSMIDTDASHLKATPWVR